MLRFWYICLLLLFSSFINAKEHYIRLPSGQVVVINTPEDISLENAIISGSFQTLLSSTDSSSIDIEDIDDALMTELLSVLPIPFGSTYSLSSGSNMIELINICNLPVQGEEKYKNKCAVPTCKKKFASSNRSSTSKRAMHHKTHFKPEFLQSLEGQLVICPYCHDTMRGMLSTIMIHFSKYCSGRKW